MSLPSVCRMCSRHLCRKAQYSKSRAMLERILRVDHAGEFGAVRIDAGHIAVLGNTSVGPVIKEMQNQEKEHLKEFERLMAQHGARPTVLLPIWNVACFMLGAGSALLGKEGAMACTVAIETLIEDHYNSQIRELMADEEEQHKTLLEKLKTIRDEEIHHRDIGLHHNAEKAPFYKCMTKVIKAGCKGAIWISERI